MHSSCQPAQPGYPPLTPGASDSSGSDNACSPAAAAPASYGTPSPPVAVAATARDGDCCWSCCWGAINDKAFGTCRGGNDPPDADMRAGGGGVLGPLPPPAAPPGPAAGALPLAPRRDGGSIATRERAAGTAGREVGDGPGLHAASLSCRDGAVVAQAHVACASHALGRRPMRALRMHMHMHAQAGGGGGCSVGMLTGSAGRVPATACGGTPAPPPPPSHLA